MTFHNTPDGYRGMEPADNYVVGSTYYRDQPPQLRDGLYYRTDVGIEPITLEAKLVGSGATVLDFQRWTDSAWKAEPGTFSAIERFERKLLGEVKELKEEVIHYNEWGENSGELRGRIERECGDVLWCVSALACCVHADIDHGLKNLLYKYVVGTQFVEELDTIKPSWHDAVSALATKYDVLEITDIDSVVGESGFEPQFSPVMNIYKESGENSLGDHFNTLAGYCLALIVGARNQYGRQTPEGAQQVLFDELLIYYQAVCVLSGNKYGRQYIGAEQIVLSTEFAERSRQAGEVVAQIYLEVALIAHRIGASLGKVIEVNVSKLSQRVTSHTVDKVDGE